MAQPFRTDALRPSSLPSATLGKRHTYTHPGSQDPTLQSSLNEQDLTAEERSKRELDKEYERWNQRIDRDIKSVAGGLKEILSLADIGPSPSALTASTLPLHLPLRTSSLIRSALNIRDLAHELKLLLVLGDEQALVRNRDTEMKIVRADVERKRKEIVQLFRGSTSTGRAADNVGGEADVDVDVEAEDSTYHAGREGGHLAVDLSPGVRTKKESGIAPESTTRPEEFITYPDPPAPISLKDDSNMEVDTEIHNPAGENVELKDPVGDDDEEDDFEEVS